MCWDFFAFVLLTSRLEKWALQTVVGSAILIVALALACAIVPRIGHDEEEVYDTLVFDEGAPVAFDLLDLGKGS